MATAISGTPATTPNAIRFTITNTDASSLSPQLTQASLVAACAPGPLKQFLQGLSTAQFNLLGSNPALSIVGLGLGTAMGLSATFSGGNMPVTPMFSGAGTATLTLRFIQSDDR